MSHDLENLNQYVLCLEPVKHMVIFGYILPCMEDDEYEERKFE